MFACINAAFLPPIYFFYPETKGLSLERVDLLFTEGHVESFEEAKQQNQHVDHLPGTQVGAGANVNDVEESKIA